MPTLYLRVDLERMAAPETKLALARAAAILREGGTVAFPTETVYGLGANALDEKAVAGIFKAKDRPHWDPLIVHVSDERMLKDLVLGWPEHTSAAVARLMEQFWPGPLTLLLPRSSSVPDAVTAGRALVGVRMPAHPVAAELIRLAGVPVAAPSANRFGRTSPTTAQHVLEDLDGRIDALVDAGPAVVGVESTVIDPNVSPMIVYRPGAVTLDQIRTALGADAGAVESFAAPPIPEPLPQQALPSPGVGLRHYAPKARLVLFEVGGDGCGLGDALRAQLAEFAGERLGLMQPDWPECAAESWTEGKASGEAIRARLADGTLVTYRWGKWAQPEELATRLFAGLRFLDGAGCTVILCPLPPDNGIGAAIRDRLRKGAIPA